MVDAETSAVVLKLKVERAKLIERWEKSAGKIWVETSPECMRPYCFRAFAGKLPYAIPAGEICYACIVWSNYKVPLERLPLDSSVVRLHSLLPPGHPRGFTVTSSAGVLVIDLYPTPDRQYDVEILYTSLRHRW